MSFNRDPKLIKIAKQLCRDLRKSQTPEKKILWERIRNRKFFGKKFYRQYPIFYDQLGKETFYIADFLCFECRLIIELDGKIHLKRKGIDKIKDNNLLSLGFKVIRIKNEELQDIDEVLGKISKFIITNQRNSL